ncbi:sodium-dependent glucose transporter 1-like [Oppia nitens]|uniref:sodium-dependent glucose transporter 1-like n=1 Tax=Oppia nitens TaxID=1686743 RepID=UPI0023DC44D7|nr:sodium-dependent glucose transporter 1-like [Oppia nitens]
MHCGSSIAVIGPTLLDIRQSIGANQAQINIIFPVGSMGYLLGSILGGVIYEHFDSQLSIAMLVSLMTVCELWFPWNRSVIGLSVTQFIMGLGGGGLDTAGNVWLLHMWGKRSAPFMQALHFTFGLGAFIAPLIAEPFLSTKHNGTDIAENAEIVVNTGDVSDRDLMVWYPYTIIAALGLVTVILLVIMYFNKSTDKPHPSIQNNESLINMTLRQKVVILFIASVIFHSYCGLEIAFGRFMTTFAFYCDLNLNKSIGAYMTSVFWGTFTLVRALTIFIVDSVGTTFMLWADIIIVLIGNIVLIMFGNTSELGLWVGVSLMGIGTSSIFPTLLSFIEELLPVTSRIGSLFLVVACLGEFTIPFIVGYYIESYPLVLMYVTTVASVICFVFFAILCFVAKLTKDVYRQQRELQEKADFNNLKAVMS